MKESSAIAACLAELRAKREILNGLIRSLEQFEPAGPRCAPPLLVRQVMSRHKAAKKNSGNGHGRVPPVRKRQAVVQPLREVVDTLSEPFNAADAEAALLGRGGVRAGDLSVGYHLRSWADKGELQVVVRGKPGCQTTFKRSANWMVDPGRSPAESRYKQFRSTIKTPEPVEA